MIDLNQLEKFYPPELQHFKKNIFREYLQYKIIEIIFDSPFGKDLVFMGGTAIHIVYGSHRFSEDLDFDNRGLSPDAFKVLGKTIKDKLKLEGYRLEIKFVLKKASRIYIRFFDVLYQNKISPHQDAVLLIRIDSQPQHFDYAAEKVVLNKFDVFSQIFAVPIDILLAQKIYCLFSRPRLMGRDFYDIVYLLGKTRPNLDYLKTKLKIKDKDELMTLLLEKCRHVDFKQLSKDTEAFLFSGNDKKKILLFYDYLKGVAF